MVLTPQPLRRPVPIEVYNKGQRITLHAWYGTDTTRLMDDALEGATVITLRDTANLGPGHTLRISPADSRVAESAVVQSVNHATRQVTLTAALAFNHLVDPELGVVDRVFRLVDTTTTAFEYIAPGGEKQTVAYGSLTLAGTGHYTYQLTLNTPGDWRIRTISTGQIETADWTTVRVRPDPF